MDAARHVQPTHSRAPEPPDLHWLRASLPDGLYVLPPDAAGLPAGQGERAAETILVASIALAVGLLVILIAIMAAAA